MGAVRSICVYCGSSTGVDARHAEAARRLGTILAAENIRLVYGGGSVGLMGVLADAVLAAGGEVVGVLPRGLFSQEVAHTGLTELRQVASMHERKQVMCDLSDAFVALPGGLGTLEELAEITTWAQLGIHEKPIVVLDEAGYWAGLRTFFDQAVDSGFVVPSSRDLVRWVHGVDDVLAAVASYRAPPAEGSLTAGES